jgi:PleD family two-component response regulator
MMQNTTFIRATSDAHSHDVADAIQRVMIVNGCFGILELIETILEAGRYDVVFVSSNEHAYSQIKLVQPDLVILCVRIDHLDGFQVLSMLKLDKETRDIPVLTYTSASDNHEWEEENREPVETDLFKTTRLELMN